MDSPHWHAILDWISRHPLAAGVVIFLIAFLDALLIVGVAVPASPLLIAVGVLVGLGHIDPLYALACAAAGAFCGDGVSYLAGRRYGDSLRRRWPFSRYPEWLEHGDRSFRRHGMKSLIIGRFVGAVRPFIPAIAGMLRMPAPKYIAATTFASLLWALAFLGPGWLLGASLDLVAAVAGRLAIVIGLVLVLIAAIWGLVFYVWRWMAPRTNDLLAQLLAWSHRHPVLGRYSAALIDPKQRESPSLLVFAVALLAAAWGFFELLASVGAGLAPSRLDLAVHQAMFGLRHPLADPMMGFLASLGDLVVLGPAVALVAAWLFWRRRPVAAWHWIAAPAFALVGAWVLGALIDLPKPPAATAVAGFSFPSQPVMLATVVYGFLAVMVARELPGPRIWPYVLGALLVGLLGFSRLYLGAHWLSDVLAGICLGLVWVTVLGIAYRRRVVRSFWARPVTAMFFGTVLLVGGWHAGRSADRMVAAFDPPLLRQAVDTRLWLQGDPRLGLPARRTELRSRDAWPLNVQYAGDLDALAAHLADRGWARLEPGDWRGLLMMLDEQSRPDTLPVMPSTHGGHAESLLMGLPVDADGRRVVLRLWHAPYRLGDGESLWLGTVQELRFATRGEGFVRYWRAEPALEAAQRRLASDAAALRVGPAQEVLRLREPPASAGS
ncbi:MAG: VTT domain-containing protein [Xanthomonadaceae bacterium]|jgi:membrane protein DedA with SNARE-associated domain/membrane-associated phospholipid phosphatase|nr:VTT domain-containing protein [Xanthomonadaceae bacterium]